MCIVTVKSVTMAMKGRSALASRGIEGQAVSLDPSFTSRGCAYGLSFPCGRREEVFRILQAKNVIWGEFLGEGRL